jgi:hypothetical protein
VRNLGTGSRLIMTPRSTQCIKKIAERLRRRASSTEMLKCRKRLTWFAEWRQMMAQASVP